MAVLFFGDSIAHGYRTASKGVGTTKVGANPTQVLKQINDYLRSNPSLAGTTVYLSSGYSNNATDSQLATIRQQVSTLKNAGANVILLGVSNTFKGNAQTGSKMNNNLSSIAKAQGATFNGGFEASSDNVHPKNYQAIKGASSQTNTIPATSTALQANTTAQVTTPMISPPTLQPIPTDYNIPAFNQNSLFGSTQDILGLNTDILALTYGSHPEIQPLLVFS